MNLHHKKQIRRKVQWQLENLYLQQRDRALNHLGNKWANLPWEKPVWKAKSELTIKPHPSIPPKLKPKYQMARYRRRQREESRLSKAATA